MEYCKDCLENKCSFHKWFTDLKLKDEDEILLAELNHILEYKIIGTVVEKIYLVSNHLNYIDSMYVIDFIDGNLNFTINTPPSAKKDGYFIPVGSYSGKDDLVNHYIEISVDVIRHNPMSLKIMKSIFDNTMLDEVQLIYSNDYLHMESIEDYKKIVELAESRLKQFIISITPKKNVQDSIQ